MLASDMGWFLQLHPAVQCVLIIAAVVVLYGLVTF